MSWTAIDGGNEGVSRFSFPSLAILACSLAAGVALFSLVATPGALICLLAAAAALGALLFYPEFALALYVVVGDVKGDDRVASLLPYDLTLVLGAVLLAGIALNFLRGKRTVAMPPAYFLLVALVAMMTASLAYTPVFADGLEKLARFLTVTGIVIVAPFAVLGTPRAMKRFFTGFALAAYAICAWSLLDLGGAERLVTPSNNTIGLGHIACALILLIWFTVVPRFSFPWRSFTYALLAVPAVALIGSGSRGSAIACGIVVFISLFFYRRLWLDLVSLGVLGFAALPFFHIPASSIEYLGSLIGSGSARALLSFRGDLLDFGWKLLQQHPLVGTGIQGFRYASPNPALYNWPHNIFLEIACELGIPAGLLACALFATAIRESIRQLRDRASRHFVLSQVAAALLAIGIVNAMNTGDINSDRSTWLFLSLVFVVRGFRGEFPKRARIRIEAPHPVAA
ncbi:MAG TPA: O-antigen ligase family protein [Candidatus Acidoferrales bacterium]|nr:O-antigen ligase family protein [Candidatus Acidoferrales bacterium]